MPAVPFAQYWEDRARRFAVQGEGLAAVCSYGMPEFYNRAIQLTQELALEPWLECSGKRVLDIGCGVGRWSRRMAARGALVTGVDLSATMVAEASRRAAAENLAARCRFLVRDISELDLGAQYDRIIGVTVLQHILDPARLECSVQALAAHLAPGGRMVLVEAAPDALNSRCDTDIFTARRREDYLALFQRCGLSTVAITGVDPAPFRTAFLPYYRRLPGPIALSGLAAVTALSLPLDAVFGRKWVAVSWHKLFVLEQAGQAEEWTG
jgi:SAM-dependent methyltransferase